MQTIIQRPMPDWAYQRDEQTFLLVLAGPELSNEHIRVAIAAFAATDTAGQLTWTEHRKQGELGHCVAATFSTSGATAFALLQALGVKLSAIDVLILPRAQRTKTLLICDMDSTIIPTESLDELAEFMGIGERIAAITEGAMNGEIDFQDALDQRVKLLEGLGEDKINECVAQTQINSGAKELLAHAREQGTRTVLVSGGFSPFVEHVANSLNFDHWVANKLELENGKLTGKVVPPIVDKNTKLEVLNQECVQLNIEPSQCVSIGDGANDIEMLKAAGCGIAYRAKQLVLESTPYHLLQGDFLTLKYWLDFSAPS